MQALSADLEYVFKQVEPLFDRHQENRIFLTGGTGFFGKWLLLIFMKLIEEGYRIELVILSRDPQKFIESFPALKPFSKRIQFIKGDVRHFEYPSGEFSYVIHAATAASAGLNQGAPLEMFDAILEGTRRVLEFCKLHKTKPHVLFVSSGAVYGQQPTTVTHIPETFLGAPAIYHEHNAYAVGKYTAEHLCYQYSHVYDLPIKIARPFAFIGPYLPLDIHFAIGNFIRDALKGGPIVVNGDGSPFRSYQYAADLVVWLLHILVRGKTCYPYNVGSDEDYDIAEIAHGVSAQFSHRPEVVIKQAKTPGQKPSRYVPSVKRALSELNLPANLRLEESLSRTILWHQQLKQ